MTIQIIKGDCLDAMRGMGDESVDIVFYDPQYNIKKKYDGYSDNKSPEEYKKWMSDIYAESQRVSKKGVLIYVGGKLLSLFYSILPENVHLIVVHKRAAGVFSGNYMLQYHGLFSTVKPVIKTKDLWDDVRLPGEGYYFREPRYDHPGLTGLSLTEKVISNFSSEGDTVLDPFSGTGTSLCACRNLGRNGIGIEQSQKYIEIAKERLNSP